jgi:predicted nucleic acid-binding protein
MAASKIGVRAEANEVDSVAANEGGRSSSRVLISGASVNYSTAMPTFTGGQCLSVADASVVAVAERLNIREIATLDGLDFSIVRPRHVEHFTVLP